MSKKLCDDCIHAHRVTGFPEADMFFVCECEYDPRVPLIMDDGVICPLYKKRIACERTSDEGEAKAE